MVKGSSGGFKAALGCLSYSLPLFRFTSSLKAVGAHAPVHVNSLRCATAAVFVLNVPLQNYWLWLLELCATCFSCLPVGSWHFNYFPKWLCEEM